jgi:predicted ATPase
MKSFFSLISIFKNIFPTYKDFGYEIIEIPKDNIKKRVDFILKAI